MRVTIIAPGSRGDVQPYVALGAGLKEAGHSIKVLTSKDFQELITSYDLEFCDLGGGSMQTVAQSMQGLMEQGNFLKILSSMGEVAQRMALQTAESGLTACRGADLIIAGLGGLFPGLALSQKLSIPFLQAFYFPFTPTGEFPNALAPLPPVHLPAPANRLTHRLVQQMIWQNYRAADNKARDQILHIPRAPFWGPFTSLHRRGQPILYGYSPQVIPPSRDWDDFIHVTGYWFLDPPAEWEPSVDLIDFLQSGPPPVYIGFGSMVNSKPEETTEMVLRRWRLPGSVGCYPPDGVA